MKVGDIVIAPQGVYTTIQPNKEYVVTGIWDDYIDDDYGYGFNIIDDYGGILNCLEKKCCLINEQDWILSHATHEKVKDDKTIIK